MLLTEPIVAFICLYAACEFATLFSFFAAIPFIFESVYGFSLEDSGLAFLAIVVGCLLGALTVLLCDVFLYRRQARNYPAQKIPPEHRLYPALLGSVCLPIGLFWFGWTSRIEIHWASPIVAIMLFAWGNLCVFVSTTQYMVDTYLGLTVASAMSANSLARYGLAAAFPLFTTQSEFLQLVLFIRIPSDLFSKCILISALAGLQVCSGSLLLHCYLFRGSFSELDGN